MANITREQMEQLIFAQQGELNAVYMYEQLAKKVKDQADREAFTRLAKDEARHAEVFQQYTNKTDLVPKKTKGIFLPILYKIIGKKRLYPLIAQGEFDAAHKYKPLIEHFPEVEAVMNDETHHGKAVQGLI